MGKVKKAVEDAVSDVGHAVSKATKQVKKTGSKIVKKAGSWGKGVIKSSTGFVKNIAKGDVVGALSNVPGIVTMGTIDTSGRGEGIIKTDAKKQLAKVMGVKTDLGASGVGSVTIPETYKTGNSGLLQLRKGRGRPGGGSYTETAKNPLGGTAGKTGK